MPNEQQERYKRFDDRFPQDRFGRIGTNPHNFVHNTNLKSFIDEEVALAVANKEKEILEMIESVKATKNDSFSHALEQFKKIIINLISKNK